MWVGLRIDGKRVSFLSGAYGHDQRISNISNPSTWADTQIRVPLAYFGKKVDELEP